MQFDIITIFPDIFKSYFKESIIKRAQKKGLIKVNVYNLRDFTDDRHKTVDDRPYGGGAGMVLKIEPIYKAVSSISSKLKTKNSPHQNKFDTGQAKLKTKRKIILFSAKGKKFDQKLAKKFSKLDELILICGRYEGVDERVARHIADMEISVGDYVLTGGEIPAMILVDAITRLLPGVIKKESLIEESFGDNLTGEYPQFTRPEKFCPEKGVSWGIPKVLLSGHHKKIENWRKAKQKINN